MKSKLLIIVFCFMALFAVSANAECSYLDSYGDHDWINGETAATCVEDGAAYRDCSVCALHEVIGTEAAKGHSWIEGGSSADCTKSGEIYRDCSICGKHEIVEASEALGHVWSESTAEATCETGGKTIKTCDRCGQVETVDATEATGHSWKEYTVNATCEKSGEVYKVCESCEKKVTVETISALTHDWVDKELISEADCENDGSMRKYCTVCNEERVFILPADGHSYSEWEIVQSASCTSEGEKTRFCFNCGEENTEDIPRAEHDYGEWEITIEATDSSMGKRCHKCNECGASAEEWYYPEGALYRGMDKNDDVLEMQKNLIELGYLYDKTDGIFGKKTEQAVMDFQKDAGIEESGIAYPQTLEAITAAMGNSIIPAAEEIAEHCEIIISDGMIVEIVYCPEHSKIRKETEVIYKEAEDTVAALAEIRDIWLEELALLHDSRTENADETDAALIEKAYGEFEAYLATMEALWQHIYKDAPETAAVYANDLIRLYCVNICSMIE